jgi:hypothetical protein
MNEAAEMRSSPHIAPLAMRAANVARARAGTCQHTAVGAVRQQRRDEREGFDICVDPVARLGGGLVLVAHADNVTGVTV